MGYMHIELLYRPAAQQILKAPEVYALEKVHGTSANVAWNADAPGQELHFHSGGESHTRFVGLFDAASLAAKFRSVGHSQITVYGEAYGGKQQGMSATYGKELHFIAFDVKVGDLWLSVPDAVAVVEALGLEFVPWVKVTTDLPSLDAERDRDSIVAVRRGMGPGKKREGIVLRPLVETVNDFGERLIAKYKCADFEERATPPPVNDPAKTAVLTEAAAIAEEWVTPQRLAHVLDKLQPDGVLLDMKSTPVIIKAMVADVYREAAGEIVESPAVASAIGKRAAQLFKARLNEAIGK